MHIGIDFGTSYSAAAAIVNGELSLVRFGAAEQFRTAVFFPELVPDPGDFQLTSELEAQLEIQLRLARTRQREMAAAAAARGQTPVTRSEGDIHREALREVRRQWMEQQAREATASVASFQHALFGEEAVEGYLDSGGGNLIESPKSMFGYRLDPQVRKVIVHIATHILEHIRLTASRQFGTPVRGAVIGRPVEFRSSMGAQGSAQAIEILREAAAVAGFDQVSFLEEPAAAAMHYHKSLDARQHADIFGPVVVVADVVPKSGLFVEHFVLPFGAVFVACVAGAVGPVSEHVLCPFAALGDHESRVEVAVASAVVVLWLVRVY